MSALFYPHRHHNRSAYHGLVPWSRPSSFAVSPFQGRDTDPFGFSQPFLSLFNDTFNQLDRLSSDLDSQLQQSFGSSNPTSWQNLLTSTPKFDVKETETNYVLEGELPGVAKGDISLNWADDNTLVLKTQTSTFKETRPNTASTSDEPSAQIAQTTESSADKSPTEMSGANPDVAKSNTNGDSSTENDTALTKTNQSTDVAKPAPASPTYHLTERTHSTFQRVFSFAGKVKHDDVKASLKNGVLTVTVPKLDPEPAKEEQKTRSVTVEDANETQDAEMVDAEKAKL